MNPLPRTSFPNYASIAGGRTKGAISKTDADAAEPHSSAIGPRELRCIFQGDYHGTYGLRVGTDSGACASFWKNSGVEDVRPSLTVRRRSIQVAAKKQRLSRRACRSIDAAAAALSPRLASPPLPIPRPSLPAGPRSLASPPYRARCPRAASACRSHRTRRGR